MCKQNKRSIWVLLPWPANKTKILVACARSGSLTGRDSHTVVGEGNRSIFRGSWCIEKFLKHPSFLVFFVGPLHFNKHCSWGLHGGERQTQPTTDRGVYDTGTISWYDKTNKHSNDIGAEILREIQFAKYCLFPRPRHDSKGFTSTGKLWLLFRFRYSH